MKKIGILGVGVLLAAGAFALYWFRGTEADRIVVKLEPGPPQPKLSTGEAGIDPAAIQLAVDYATKQNSSALVIARNGHIVFEKYWGDTHLDTPIAQAEFASALPALLVGSLMGDRLVTNLDDPVSNYLPEYASAPTGSMSLRQLLGGQPADAAPPAELVALILERLAKQPFETLVVERLWKPIGGGEISFARNESSAIRGNAATAGCCVTARISDWMRIGEMLANDGVFEANQFAPPRFVTLMLTPTHKESAVGLGVKVDGRFAAADAAWLSGAKNQRLWIVPSLQLVILRAGEAGDAWDEAMIPDSIIRGTSGWKPKSAGEEIDPNKFAPH